MTKEEIKEYLNRVEELELKLIDEDKDTLQWLIYGYNVCAKLLQENEQRIDKTINSIETTIQIIGQQPSRDEEEDKYILSRLESFIKTLEGSE